MPFADLPDVRLHYRIDGPEGAPWLVLSNSLGTNLEMWAPQMPTLQAKYRVLRYDKRGHGQSGVTPGPYTVAQLGRDVVDLLDAMKIERAHFCGLSLGGATGMWLGVNAAERFGRLVLSNTAAKIGTPEVWNTRIAAVRKDGMAAIADGVISRWFTAPFAARAPAEVATVREAMLRQPPEGYVACCAAVRDMDLREAIAAIRAPTLVIAGTHDLPTPPADARAVAERIPDARFVELPAAHISNIECAAAFTLALTHHLAA